MLIMNMEKIASNLNKLQVLVMAVGNTPPDPDTRPAVSRKNICKNNKTIVAKNSEDVEARASETSKDTDTVGDTVGPSMVGADPTNADVVNVEVVDANMVDPDVVEAEDTINIEMPHVTRAGQMMEDSNLSKENNAIRPCRRQIECPICEQMLFYSKSNLRRHMLRKHPTEQELLARMGRRLVKCQTCQQQFSHIKYLKGHLKAAHDMHFDEQEMTFNNEQEFLAWKDEVEMKTDSVYIKASGPSLKAKRGEVVRYFRCNRSGNYRQNLKTLQRIRSSKSYSTVKMNSHCTSVIKLVTRPQQRNGLVTVNFCATHYGHDGFKECRDMASERRLRMEPRVRRNFKKESKMIGSFEPSSDARSTMVQMNGDVSSTADEAVDMDGCSKEAQLVNRSKSCNDTVENRTLTEDVPTDPDEESQDVGELSPKCQEDNAASTKDLNDSNDKVPGDVLPPLTDIRDGRGGGMKISEDVISPKKRFINSLQTLINVVERCQSDNVLNLAASSIEGLTRTFVPLLGVEPPDTAS